MVIGWKRIDENENDSKHNPSSLTTKTYKLPEGDHVQYSVILDAGDAHLHYTKRREPGNMNVSMVHQSDLSPVTDER